VIRSRLGRHQYEIGGATLTLQKHSIVLEETAFDPPPETRDAVDHSMAINGPTILVWRRVVLAKRRQSNSELSFAHP
jgi:hypothetical protein